MASTQTGAPTPAPSSPSTSSSGAGSPGWPTCCRCCGTGWSRWPRAPTSWSWSTRPGAVARRPLLGAPPADGLGFVEGAAWDEHTVGTNAIGTALVVRKPVQAYSAEHFVRVHHASPPQPAPAFRGRGRLDAADPRAGPTRLTQIRQEGPGRKGDPEVAPWPGALTTRPGRRAAEPGQVHRALPGSQRATGSTRRRWSSTLRTTAPAGSRYATAETTHATSMAADVGTAPRR
jgi:hypothetical protein